VTQPVLGALERVRRHREDATRRTLEAATRAVQQALQVLQQRRVEQRAIEQDIAATLQRPYGAGGAHMLQVQRSVRRIELLREHLAKAREAVQRAQDELSAKQQVRADALRVHLRARHKREAVGDQIGRERAAVARLAERLALDAVQDMAVPRCAMNDARGAS
jgi:flagellar biosynthesis chaperone FliJ